MRSVENSEVTTIPYVDLAQANGKLRAQLLEAVGRVLDHGHLVLGPEVEELEASLARRLDVPHVVTVGNGTSALTIALQLAGIGPGDEVIAPSHSFVATASAIALVGARPVFADVEPDTAALSARTVEPLITAQTKAVMPVHLGGIPCDVRPLASLCESRGLALVEDAAQSFGASLDGRPVGSFGIGCFSLHPLKVLSAAGDGGFIALSDTEMAARARQTRNLGLRGRGVAGFIAGNSRLDTVQAAMLLVKLAHFDDMVRARRAHASAYARALGPSFRLLAEPPGAASVYSTFVVRHERRDALIAHAASLGVDLKVHYPTPIHRQPAFEHIESVDLPHTEALVNEITSLPVTPELSENDRDRIIDVLLRWAERPAGE